MPRVHRDGRPMQIVPSLLGHMVLPNNGRFWNRRVGWRGRGAADGRENAAGATVPAAFDPREQTRCVLPNRVQQTPFQTLLCTA